ncbi:MAG: 2-phosphosulfolactate phosphatase [Flavobacteriales bacterium]|nr:2-phosphosulfolactate phosphatase [Flavobacteriales bacterium]
MRKLEVCFSPDIYQAYENTKATVVVIDIFRATSAIVTAFKYGVSAIIPVEHIEQALDYKKQGFLVAAERKGEIVEGFSYGNSPYHYMGEEINNATIVLTTTNGTRALEKARRSKEVLCSSFLNISATAQYLLHHAEDVLLLCSGWKGKFNMEDSIFAGALSDVLMQSGEFDDISDSSIASAEFYKANAHDIPGVLSRSSHRKRLEHLNLEKDIEWCLQRDITDVIPVLVGEKLVEHRRRLG